MSDKKHAASTEALLRGSPPPVVPEKVEKTQKPQPLYLSIRARILDKIADKTLPSGSIIKEGPLASVFGVSRAPVRRALLQMEEDETIKSASGQGFVIGQGGEKNILSKTDLTKIFSQDAAPEVERAATWENIYDSLLLDVTNCLPFGTFRISETIACEHFFVGRTALRDALSKLLDKGYLEKTNRSHWIAGPLTANDVHEAFEIRRHLEPVAFQQSAPSINRATIQTMRAKVSSLLDNIETTDPERIEEAEEGLHRALLQNCENKRLLNTIERNQFPLIVNKIFRRNFGSTSDQLALEDHKQILDLLLRSQSDVAQKMLQAHLETAEHNTLAKLRVLSILPTPVTAPYLIYIN